MPTVTNLIEWNSAASYARRAKDVYERRSVSNSHVEEHLSQGWEVDKVLKTRTRIRKPKDQYKALEDRFWSILFRMEFPVLSGAGGAIFRDEQGRATDQIDALAQDEDVMILAECKFIGSRTSRVNYAEVIGRLHGLREPASRVSRESSTKRRIAPCLIIDGGSPNELAIQRSQQLGVPILTNVDLDYYEEIVNHLGPAAKYQLLADLLPGREVDGLKLTLPAIRGEMGGKIYYTFSMHPSDLLKISYVSHRMKGLGSDSTAYQRMIKKSRLASIKQYITEGGVFPTNIVANLNDKPRFDIAEQDSRHSDDSRFGWLTIQPKYKSAWIIDGQHRLYAYSGHKASSQDFLTILAFEKLDEATQANMFVDINSRQKSVPPSVLNALYSELHWHSDDPKDRTQAVISRAVQRLGEEDAGSPFYGRILQGEKSGEFYRSLTIAALFNKLDSSRFFFERKRGSKNMSYGPFWFEADNSQMVRRIQAVLNRWFGIVRDHNTEWWELGKAPGGGLCMNDSIVAHLDVLMTVFDYLKDEKKLDWLEATNDDLAATIEPYAHSVGQYLAQKADTARREYRSYRGSQGQTYLSRTMQAWLRDQFDEFSPAGLDDFMESQKAENKTRAKELIDELEILIKATVIAILKDEYPYGEDWWLEGVPSAVRMDVSKRREENKRAAGAEENYLYLIQYYEIISKKWGLFESVLSLGGANKRKDERLSWLKDINGWRNIVSHPTTGKGISAEEVHRIESIFSEISEKVNRYYGLHRESTD